MGGLFIMRYVGRDGPGQGVIYVGSGMILGVDTENGRYHGTYAEQAGRLKGTVTLAATVSMPLVTGLVLNAGQKLSLSLDWPSNFWGTPQHLTVAGSQVTVAFEKIGDIP
jgi:hypothetical protein